MDIEMPSEKQFEIWRKMSLSEKYALFCAHMKSVRALKRAGIKRQHPDWSEERVERELARIFTRGRT